MDKGFPTSFYLRFRSRVRAEIPEAVHQELDRPLSILVAGTLAVGVLPTARRRLHAFVLLPGVASVAQQPQVHAHCEHDRQLPILIFQNRTHNREAIFAKKE